MLFEPSIINQPMPGYFTCRFWTQFVREVRFKAGISEEEVQGGIQRFSSWSYSACEPIQTHSTVSGSGFQPIAR